VKPGKGTLAKAVKKAKNGDKLILEKKGVYKGPVTVDKRLTIKGPSDGKKLPTVDGRCDTAFTMLILANPVTLQNFKVTGATDAAASQYGGAEVNFIEGGGGSATGLAMQDGCGVKYGVNVFDTGDVLVDESKFEGYDDAGVYVGAIRNPEHVVQVTDNVATENNRGILIEDSAGNGGIQVASNTTNSNTNGFTPTGIFLHNADGVVINDNTATGNPYAGIHLDVTSDDNRLLDNTATGNAAGAQGGTGADLLNEGAGNCGAGNVFGTTAGNPLGAC
jgi:parallel beta-helix repeat protein